MNKWIKIIFGVLGTIILGAVGSGLWERFLSGIFDSIVNLSIELVSNIFTFYKDGIYENASLGFHEEYSMYFVLMFWMIMPLLYIRITNRHPESKEGNGDTKTREFMRGKKGYLLLNVLTITVMVLSFFSITKISYTNRVINYSIRSVDIVKPYIKEEEYDKLLSNFYQVRSTEDFDDFNKSIVKIATENSLKLPENAPL